MPVATGPIFPDPMSVYGRGKVDQPQLYQDWNVLGQFISANIPTLGSDASANGAFGDGVHDDTAALQQTINFAGVLFLRPGKRYLISSSIIIPNFPDIFIYGGGYLETNNAITMISSTAATNNNIRIYDIVFSISSGAGGVCISVANNTSQWNTLRGCFFSSLAGTSAVILNSNGVNWSILNCRFSGFTNGISITSQLGISIEGCFFGITANPIITSGTVGYNVRGSDILDYYTPQVTRALVYQNASQALAGSAATTLTFASTDYVLGPTSIWVAGSPTRFTASVAGHYLAIGQWAANSSITGYFQFSINKNGAIMTPQRVVENYGSALPFDMQVSSPLQLAANDYIEFVVFNIQVAAAATAANETWGSLTLLSRP